MKSMRVVSIGIKEIFIRNMIAKRMLLEKVGMIILLKRTMETLRRNIMKTSGVMSGKKERNIMLLLIGRNIMLQRIILHLIRRNILLLIRRNILLLIETNIMEMVGTNIMTMIEGIITQKTYHIKKVI